MNTELFITHWHYFFIGGISFYGLIVHMWKAGEPLKSNMAINFIETILTVFALSYGKFFESWGMIQYAFAIFYGIVLISTLFNTKKEPGSLPPPFDKYNPILVLKAQAVYWTLLWLGGFFG